MKKILFVLLFIPSIAFAAFDWNGASVSGINGASVSEWNGSSIGGAFTYEFEEGLEGTGYENSWSTVSGTPDPDYTTSPLAGSQSLLLTGDSTISTTFSAKDTVGFFQLIKITSATSSSDVSLVTLRDSGTTGRCYVRMDSNRTLQARYSATNGPNTVTALTVGTTYCLWVDFDKSGSCTIAFDEAATCTKPTSGNQYSQATGSSTNSVVTLELSDPGTDGTSVSDNIFYDTDPIGSNP